MPRRLGPAAVLMPASLLALALLLAAGSAPCQARSTAAHGHLTNGAHQLAFLADHDHTRLLSPSPRPGGSSGPHRANRRSRLPAADQPEPAGDEYDAPERLSEVTAAFAAELDPPGRRRAAAAYRSARQHCAWEVQSAHQFGDDMCYRRATGAPPPSSAPASTPSQPAVMYRSSSRHPTRSSAQNGRHKRAVRVTFACSLLLEAPSRTARTHADPVSGGCR